MDLIKMKLIDGAIDDLGGKWPSNDLKSIHLHQGTPIIGYVPSRWPDIKGLRFICTYAEFMARKAERQNKPSWNCGYRQIIQNAWGEWFGSSSKQAWHPCKKDWTSWVPLGVKGEVIGQWADTWEQRPNHIVESEEKAAQELKFAEIIKDIYPWRAAAIYCKQIQSAIDNAEIEKAAKACERALGEFFPEAKLTGWYDYEVQNMRENALPDVGEVCECFDFERNEFVRVKVLAVNYNSRETAVATINGDSFGYVFWGCKFRPLDWGRLSPKPEPEPSPELCFHLSTAFNELQASARLLPEDDARRTQLVSLAAAVNVIREVV